MNTFLKEIMKKNDIEIYGIARPDCLDKSRKILAERITKGQITEFESVEIDSRINLKNYLESPKSVIVVAVPYPLLGSKDKLTNRYMGWYTASSMGIDYHTLVRTKLNNIIEEISNEYVTLSYYLGVDTTPLIDRGFARESGIGFYGKNSFVINEDIGSAFFIGYIITDIEFHPFISVSEASCGKCTRCIDACPTGAISSKGMNPEKCISYITQKKDLNYEEMDVLGKRLYGCDVCQLVCPYNKENLRTMRSLENNYIELIEFLNISNSEYKSLYGKKSFSWRGRKIIKRNGYVILGNYKDKYLYDYLKAAYLKESKYYLMYIVRGMYLSDKERLLSDVDIEENLKTMVINKKL